MKSVEKEIFKEFLKKNGLKSSSQRMAILETFLKTEKHLTIDGLYRMIKKRHPSIGYATVFRTLKLLNSCGLAASLKFEDSMIRYEHKYKHTHHDHLICLRCGGLQEVVDTKIEELQKMLAKKHNFSEQYHRLVIYGICSKCK